MGRSSVSARTSIRDSIASSNTSLSPHSIRNERCMVMHFSPINKCSRLTSLQQIDSGAVSMLRQRPRPHQSLPQTILYCRWSLKLIVLHVVVVRYYWPVPHRLKCVIHAVKVLIFVCVYRTCSCCLCSFAGPTMPVTSSKLPALTSAILCCLKKAILFFFIKMFSVIYF